MPREATQEQGREALLLTKRWLESSTWIELPWNAYKNEPMCIVTCLDGSEKGFDLAGFFLDDQKPIYIENKGVKTIQDQYAEYLKFLAIAYSATAVGMKAKRDKGASFAWVTTHPFGYSTDWATLESADRIRAALEKHPELLASEEIDEEMLRTVAERVWLLVLNTKQERLLLSSEEVQKIYGLLGRKKDTL